MRSPLLSSISILEALVIQMVDLVNRDMVLLLRSWDETSMSRPWIFWDFITRCKTPLFLCKYYFTRSRSCIICFIYHYFARTKSQFSNLSIDDMKGLEFDTSKIHPLLSRRSHILHLMLSQQQFFSIHILVVSTP
jgi:hypothetical protein